MDGEALNKALLTSLATGTTLSAGSGSVNAGDSAGEITLNQLSSSELEFEYLLKDPSSFSFVTLSNSSLMNLSGSFTFAARGGLGTQVRAELTDINGLRANFTINLDVIYQNYTINFTGSNTPAGFDASQIDTIVFVTDQETAPASGMDLVKILVSNLEYTPTELAPEFETLKNELIQSGLQFFTPGSLTIDPETHFPYDAINTDDTLEPNSKFSQPTLIGFYLQMLADGIKGEIDYGAFTQLDLLNEINAVVDNLLSVQSQFGWNGLLPFMHLDRPEPNTIEPVNEVGMGDNMNLALSLGSMMGALETAGLSGTNLTFANSIIAKAETFLDNQEPGYLASIEQGNGNGIDDADGEGLFRNAYRTDLGVFASFLDRTMTEFRSGIAFVVARYPSIPDTVWDDLKTPLVDYRSQDGTIIPNASTFDGTAFQMFWPLLRTNERDFIGFRHASYNQFVTHTDFSNLYNIPGFLSASEIPENGIYVGDLGIRELQEGPFGELTMDVGSTYALASAFSVDPETTMQWLLALREELPALSGTYGFADAARSNTEIGIRYLGIDLASTVLGLVDNGRDALDSYLRTRGIERDFNLLFDRKSTEDLPFEKTEIAPVAPPEFADRSFAVMRNFEAFFTLGNFPATSTFAPDEVHLDYDVLDGGFAGIGYNLNEIYDATANKLVIQYSVIDSPGSVKIELKDINDQLLFETTESLVSVTPALSIAKLEIDLPNNISLSEVQKFLMIIDQNATGDMSGDFKIHSINFLHFPSSQDLLPNSSLGTGNVTTLSGTPDAQLIASSGSSSLNQVSSSLTQLNFDVTSDGFAAASINFDPAATGQTADLSGQANVVFGLESAQAKRVKIEVDDASGGRAIFYATDINTTRNYYEFLTDSLAQSIDINNVTRITFVVEPLSVDPGDELGQLTLELGGLQFP